MIAIFDEDGGGDVDFREFVSGLSAFSSKGNKEEKLRFAFKVYDIDRDGYISNGELFIVLKMMVGSNLKDQQLQQVRDLSSIRHWISVWKSEVTCLNIVNKLVMWCRLLTKRSWKRTKIGTGRLALTSSRRWLRILMFQWVWLWVSHQAPITSFFFSFFLWSFGPQHFPYPSTPPVAVPLPIPRRHQITKSAP